MKAEGCDVEVLKDLEQVRLCEGRGLWCGGPQRFEGGEEIQISLS